MGGWAPYTSLAGMFRSSEEGHPGPRGVSLWDLRSHGRRQVTTASRGGSVPAAPPPLPAALSRWTFGLYGRRASWVLGSPASQISARTGIDEQASMFSQSLDQNTLTVCYAIATVFSPGTR